MAASSSQTRSGIGLRSRPGVTHYSKDTQDMIRTMMEEARLNDLQRNKINKCLKSGLPLPFFSEPASPASPPQPKSCKSVKKCFPGKPQKRSAEACRSGNSYIRERFRPGPTSDLEKEKRRLQNIMATGKEEPEATQLQDVPACENPDQKDRYQEVLDEIESRRQFLSDMASLGQERPYIHIINFEISQRIQELESLDKAPRLQKEAMISPRKEDDAGQMT